MFHDSLANKDHRIDSVVASKFFLSSIIFYDYKQNIFIINPHGHNRWLNWRNVPELILLTDVLNY